MQIFGLYMPTFGAMVLFWVLLALASPAEAEHFTFSKDLCLSKAHENMACAVHVVKRGESLWGIAGHYRSESPGITPQHILALPENKYILERKVPFHKLGKKSGIKGPKDYLLPGDKITIFRKEKAAASLPPPAETKASPAQNEVKEEAKILPDVPRVNLRGAPPESFNPIVNVLTLRKGKKETAQERFWVLAAAAIGLGLAVSSGIYFLGRRRI